MPKKITLKSLKRGRKKFLKFILEPKKTLRNA